VPWKLTVRAGPKVRCSRHPTLSDALDTLQAAGEELSLQAQRDPLDLRYKRFEPIQQVAARLEVAGPERLLPSVRGGVDVRGDGSAEPYLGRVRREVIKQRKGETAYKALRRALKDSRH
jgi:hypothetical protein